MWTAPGSRVSDGGTAPDSRGSDGEALLVVAVLTEGRSRKGRSPERMFGQ